MEAKIVSINMHEFAAKGKQVYTQIRAELEAEHKGEVVAIEPESGDYFLGKTMGEAGDKAREKHPNKVFYFARIGHRAVHVLRRRRSR